MASSLTVTAAAVDVDGVVITVQRTGDDVYLLTFEGQYPHSVKGYDNVLSAAEAFAKEVAPVVAVRAEVEVAHQAVEEYALAKADAFEAAKEAAAADAVKG